MSLLLVCAERRVKAGPGRGSFMVMLAVAMSASMALAACGGGGATTFGGSSKGGAGGAGRGGQAGDASGSGGSGGAVIAPTGGIGGIAGNTSQTGAAGVAGAPAGGSAGALAGRDGATGGSGAIGGNGTLASGGAIGSGGAGGGHGGAGGGDGSGPPTWTVMVYASGDNNLSGDLFSDLLEMSQATLDPSLHLIVYVDYPSQVQIPGSTELFPAGTEVYQIPGNGVEPQLLASAAEEDFDDPKVLANAVKAVFSQYPADRRALILWDHGGSWRFGFGGDQQDGTRATPTGMPFEQAAQAVRAGLNAAGITEAPPLEFFAFDTCLLGSPEVASAFSDLTKVYIGNAELDYGAGWDYVNTLSWLSAHPAASAKDFARQESVIWNAHHSTSQDDKLFKSHVALDMTALGGFSANINALVSAAQANQGALDVARAFDLSLPDYFVENINDTSPLIPLKDVGQILSSLRQSQNPQIAKAAQAAQTSMTSLVLANVNGGAREGQGGLNIGAGVPIEFTSALSSDYRRLVTNWNGATHWADLVDFVRGASDGVGPTISSTGVFAGRQLPFTVPDADLLSVEFTLWRSVGKRLYMLQMLNRSYAIPGTYDFMWSGNVGAINATPNPVLVTLLPWRDVSTAASAPPILKAIGILKNGQEELYTELLVDVPSLSAELALVYLEDLPTVFPIASLAGPGTVFWPMFVYLDGNGEVQVEKGATGLAFSGGAVGFTSVSPPSGSYAFGLQAKDVWGNKTTHFYDLSVP